MPKLPESSIVEKELLALIGERLLVLPENFGTSDDLQEGLAAFGERRSPEFRGH
mgnify:CR=1 FL=1